MTADPNLFRHALREAWQRLVTLNGERASTETAIDREFETATEAALREQRETRAAADASRDEQLGLNEDQHRRSIRHIEKRFKQKSEKAKQAYEIELRIIDEKADHSQQEAKKQLEEQLWLTDTVFEASEGKPQDAYVEACKELGDRGKEIETIADDARKLIRRFRQPASGPWEKQLDETVPADELDRRLEDCRSRFRTLRRLLVPRLFMGVNALILGVTVVGGIAAWQMSRSEPPWQWTEQAQTTVIFAAIGCVVAMLVLYVLALVRVRPVARHLQAALAGARRAVTSAQEEARAEKERGLAQLRDKRGVDLDKAHHKYKPILDEISQRREQHLARIHEKYPALLEELEAKRVKDLARTETAYETGKQEIADAHDQSCRDADTQAESATAAARERHEQEWADLEKRWHDTSAQIQETFEAAVGTSTRLFPSWDDPRWQDWEPPTDFAPAIRFGEMQVETSKLVGGISASPRLKAPWPERFRLPAAIAFPDRCSMLLETGDEGGDEAIEVLQTVMFRLLTTLPPGKVRFTIVDPVGLGQNFAGFMHLADSLEALVNDRIWTEPRHIEQRLSDLTDHMENVIQKYLRNEYETIALYNEHAGEIAEPYRFLVIANFPVNFSDAAAKRLASVIASGARCGVYTLIAMDRRQPLPRGIELADLRKHAIILAHEEGRFVYKDEDYETLPLTVDRPPDADFMIRRLKQVGEAAKDASRVEVPFEVVAPPADRLWTGDATNELRVPLGRMGAKQLQELALGRGTSQHALIAGKTGSGKSTLFHVVITNVALWFSPDEVQLYLVDFKKGVEFKAYATHELPHARAVAIESDREFGLSILQKLDDELKRRGARFRDLGVQDLAGYRGSGQTEPMPRILLIIDEFQEFFTEDDRIAQDATLLLDRLVRQGRAFGIHVILGSQTLGGAYSLAKSTMGQMAVRIALQCSEADSYLILSEDNSAARLLARPGECIYNDASGRVEGNSPFQIVWLSEDTREQGLKLVRNMAESRAYRPPAQQIVFEGNAAADVRTNRGLDELLARETGEPAAPVVSAWLGDAVAIKDPTAAVFRRQSGSNLLIVGQREEAALASMTVGVVSTAARHRPGSGNGVAGKSFFLLDGLAADSPNAGFVDQVAATLGPAARLIGRRDLIEALQTLAAEITRRDEEGVLEPPSLYLCIFGLQRYRDLRQSDDFSFSTDEDKPPAADKLFQQVLRDGPPVGVHTMVWCDTATNVDRAFDRQTMREFDMRVVFQMSPSDSTNLIDSPAANKLGMRHALFYSEEKGVLEKFRPYGMPPSDWLEHVRATLDRGNPAAAPPAPPTPPAPPAPPPPSATL